MPGCDCFTTERLIFIEVDIQLKYEYDKDIIKSDNDFI